MKILKSIIVILVLLLNFIPLSAKEANLNETVNVVTLESYKEFSKIIGIDDNDDINISYLYSVDYSKNNFVEMNLVLESRGKEIPLKVSGCVNKYKVFDSFLYEGPLTGDIELNNKCFILNCGFAKFNSSDEVQLSLTIQDVNNKIDPVIFTFGSQLLNKEIIDNIEDINTSNANTDNVEAVNSVTYLLKTTKYANFKSNSYGVSGYGQRFRLYFAPGDNTILLGAKSYCSSVDSYLASSYDAVDTVISEMKLELKVNAYTNTTSSYIAGIKKFDNAFSNNSAATAALSALFSDALSLMSVPSSTITSVLSNLSGSVLKVHDTDDSYVKITFGATQHCNFDSVTCGLPIIFQMARSTTNYVGPSSYTAISTLKYRTLWTKVTAGGGTQTGYIYVQSNNATITTSLTLS